MPQRPPWSSAGVGDGPLAQAVALVEKLVWQKMAPEKALLQAAGTFNVELGELRVALQAAARARQAR